MSFKKWIYSLHKICLGCIYTFKDLFSQINLFDTRQKFYHCFLELNFMLKRTGCFFDPTPPLPIFPVNDHNLNSYTGIDFFLPHYHSLWNILLELVTIGFLCLFNYNQKMWLYIYWLWLFGSWHPHPKRWLSTPHIIIGDKSLCPYGYVFDTP